MANIDYCFVEEAERVSDNSWEVLIPTIRKEGSEIIISFNPKHPTDPTYIRFVSNKDDDMWVQKVSWKDNPFLPTVLNQERERLLAQDPEAYSHVWDGEFDKRNYGGIWSSYVERARDEGRICPVPYQDGCRVITAWDLGNANSTAIWFAQVVGKEPRILDFYENSFQDLAHYVEVIKNKPYAYECHYLPHDADHQRLGMPSTIAGQIENMGLKVQPIKIASIENRIEAGRDLLKRAWIDQSRCRDGILALTNYQYEWDDNRNRFKDKPEKNEFTDACDAFGYLAQSLRDMGDKIEITGSPTDHYNTPSQSSWMN